jgi:hypothetical protein
MSSWTLDELSRLRFPDFNASRETSTMVEVSWNSVSHVPEISEMHNVLSLPGGPLAHNPLAVANQVKITNLVFKLHG